MPSLDSYVAHFQRWGGQAAVVEAAASDPNLSDTDYLKLVVAVKAPKKLTDREFARSFA